MKKEIRISLDSEDFSCLVRGGILTVEDKELNILIALQDIGFHVMDCEISKAEQRIDIYKNHIKIN
mgnify:CR=1 FL=1